MFKELVQLRPYFFSLREITNKEKNTTVMIVDLKLPSKWEFALIIEKYPSIYIKEQDKSGNDMLLSVITDNMTEDGLLNLFNASYKIITYNKEEEEKQTLFTKQLEELKTLFNEKTNELKTRFKNSSLSELKEETFLIDEPEQFRDKSGTQLVKD